MAKKKQSRRRPSVDSLDSSMHADNEMENLEVIELNERLEDLGNGIDTDPFFSRFEIRLSKCLIDLSRKMAEHENTPILDTTKQRFLSLYRRPQGIPKLHKFVTKRYQQCDELLNRLDDIYELRSLSKSSSQKRCPSNVKDEIESDLERAKEPILQLRRRLNELDELLEILEPDSTHDPAEHTSEVPDFVACLGIGLAFGLEMGFHATRIRYHAALEKEKKSQAHHRKTGHTSKPSWASQHRADAKTYFVEVLRKALIDGLAWDQAYKTAGVSKRIERPSEATGRRLVIEGIRQLLGEIQVVTRSTGTTKAALEKLAHAKREEGYDLNLRTLQRLVEQDRLGALPGRQHFNWSGQASSSILQKLQEGISLHCEALGDVISSAVTSYDED